MTEDELFQQFKRSIAKNLEAELTRGHYHSISTAAAPNHEPTSLTFDKIRAAFEKVQVRPVLKAVDLPDFLKLRLYYRTNKFIDKTGPDGEQLFYKINPGLMYFVDHPTFVFHPDNEADFRQAAEAAGAFAVDLAKLQRGEVDEYGRPIEKGGESLVGQGG